jgi:molybdate transport system regulatory protein
MWEMEENTKVTDEKSLSLLKPAYKLWLETKEGYVFGEGALELLQTIQQVGTLSGGAKALGMSYRHAWGIIKEIEERIGKPLLDTHKGGKLGGGGSELTQTGRELIKSFLKFKNVFDQIRMDELSWENLFVKMSARNRIEGTVISVQKGEVAATVKIKIDTPCTITSFITREAVEDLKIEEGNRATAVIKATEVMVSKD